MTNPIGKTFISGLKPEIQPSGYPENWNQISAAFRKKYNYTCYQCGVCCEQYPELIDAHHLDGDKSNCAYTNLQCLCKYHHQEEHPHYQINDGDMQKLRQLWKEQKIPAPAGKRG